MFVIESVTQIETKGGLSSPQPQTTPPPTAAPRPTLANALPGCIQISWISLTEPCFQCLTPSSKKWDKCRMYDLFSIRCNLASFSTKVGHSKMQSSTNHLFYILGFGQWCIIIRPNGPSANVAAAEVSWEMTELTGVHCGYNWHLDTHDTLLQSNTNTNRNTYGKYNHIAIQKTSLGKTLLIF